MARNTLGTWTAAAAKRRVTCHPDVNQNTPLTAQHGAALHKGHNAVESAAKDENIGSWLRAVVDFHVC